MRIFRYLLALIVLSWLSSAVAMQTAENVDLNKYLGKWYEIARFDAWFEKDCVNATAEYSLNSNGIDVLNSCRLKSPEGRLKKAYGRAVVVPDSGNAKLKVSFLPKFLSVFDSTFSGDYWILKLDPKYQVVLVGEPSKEYLWILARTPELDPKTYAEYVEYAKSLGFDVSKLHKN